jgi:hypothetical protein
MMTLGRIRLGDKGTKIVEGETKTFPRKLSKFRLTSASRSLLESAAAIYGGEVHEWEGAPDEGMFEVYTDTDVLDIILPPVFASDGKPTLPYSQSYELWSGKGCQRRCDGTTEVLSGKPCKCKPDDRECKLTTRLNVMLPKVAGLGVWRLETKGENAASVLPGTLDLLMLAASERQFIPAQLRAEQRSSKSDGQTRRFVVPVIDLPGVTMEELLSARPAALNMPTATTAPCPELPAASPIVETEPDEREPEIGHVTPIETDEWVEADLYAAELSELSAELETEGIEEKISRNRGLHTNNPAEHIGWLIKSIDAAKAKLGTDTIDGEVLDDDDVPF